MIGERLRKLRKDKKLNQSELGSILGVQNAAVSRYENDKDDPSDKIKVEIAKYFNISLDYLLGVIDEPVSCYNEEKFLRLPEHLTKEETAMTRYRNT